MGLDLTYEVVWRDVYETAWRDIIVLTVWIFVVTSIVTSVGHLLTAWVTAHQRSQTPLGPALTKRELALGIKLAFRVGFDVILLLVVTWRFNFTNSPVVLVIVTPLIVASAMAIWYMGRYIIVLRREAWRHPVEESAFSEEVAETIDETHTDVQDVQERVTRIEQKLGANE